MTNCHLKVGNGNEYPEVHYIPNADIVRVFRDVLKYVHGNNDYQGGTQLDLKKFQPLYPFIYFDLTKQKMDVKDGVIKLTFEYQLSAGTNTDYSVYALVLYEQEVELIKEDGKLLLRA